MSLIVPPFAFSKFAHNLASTPTASMGTLVTTGASNADGSTASCISALGFDVQLLKIGLYTNNASATDTSTLIHVVIDRAGGTSWDTTNKHINNILCGYAASSVAGAVGSKMFYFPVYIPAGASIGALGRNVTGATRGVQVSMRAFGGITRPELWPTCKNVISIGDTPASSKGTTITPGSSGAAGTWTSVGSTTSKDLFGVVLAVQGIGTVTGSLIYHVEVGISSTAIGPPYHVSTGTTEIMATESSFPIYATIPAGSQLQCRATCSGAADNIDVCLYGLG